MTANEIANSRLHQADEFLSRGATYGGFVRLGEVLRYVTRVLSEPSRDSWRERVLAKAERVDLKTIHAEAVAAVDRISRMVSTGGAYDAYEIVLLLTLRLELESAEALLVALGEPTHFVPRTLDEDLRALRADRHNRKAYDAALTTLRRNWGFPIESKWLT